MKGSTFGPKIFILTSITSLSHPYVSGGGKKIWYEGKNVSIGALDRSVSASVNRTNRIKERISCFTIEGVGIFLPSSLYSISLVLYSFNRRGCLFLTDKCRTKIDVLILLKWKEASDHHVKIVFFPPGEQELFNWYLSIFCMMECT